jgi:histidyl-tRNA synthetase
VDAELVSLLDLYFRELGLKETSLRINSIAALFVELNTIRSSRIIWRRILMICVRPPVQI